MSQQASVIAALTSAVVEQGLLVGDGTCPLIQPLLKGGQVPALALGGRGQLPLAVITAALQRHRAEGDPPRTLHLIAHEPAALRGLYDTPVRMYALARVRVGGVIAQVATPLN